MGLVDYYSDSESETETVQQTKPAPSAAAASKKPFPKLLDRSSGAGKIVVNLPAASPTANAAVDDGDQPPAKRAKTAGGSRFSSLGSFLPPPKKTAATAPSASGRKQGSTPAPGVHLRTAAEPAFARGGTHNGTLDDDGDTTASSSSGLNLPAPNSKGPAGPSILEGQKPEEEVKLVGKPLMFKPLSVARKKAPVKTKKGLTAVAAPPVSGVAASHTSSTAPPGASATTEGPDPPPKKKVSLFSMGDDDDKPPPASAVTTAPTGTYQPMFSSVPESEPREDDDAESAVTSAYPTYQQQQQQPPRPSNIPSQHQQDFSDLASTLTPAARRELFGRSTTTTATTATSFSSSSSPSVPPNTKVIEFDMEREYAHNEAVRASGAQQAFNPVRSIAPGKHSLRQVVNMAQSNQGALEESFARAKSNKKDAAGRYGW
ncbi:hypothetical protein N658DRAFT_461177 [Parathielavia hyrcaniae]|uniref:Mitotic checkpoint regulator, MAD2B-interacting-domain-containing protein n=1 Tax=Parathielavia hyrcaniae TaxID=113614 RepID=A0AAN6QAC3_9PEZI|nr:hypothetical protein N658DRAFT_461177 [Parathielavia hyrcaniae]